MKKFTLNLIQQLKNDASISAFVAGLVIVLVGMTSSAVLVYQAALVVGATPQEAGSWLGSLCFAMGIVTLTLSIRYKAPVLTAWSTAGAALLVTGLKGVPISDAIGAFVFSASLIFLCGVTGIFERIMSRIPIALASALLAGVLIHFALDSFSAFTSKPLLIGTMFLSYLFGRKLFPRLTMLIVLLTGFIIAGATGILHFEEFHFSFTQWSFVAPTFAWQTLLGTGIPLFVVTMASQNLTGITIMRVNGFMVPVSSLISWTGLANIITAPFGGFTINMAAVTGAIGNGPEAHPLPEKRYFSGVVSGFLYIVIGLIAGTVTAIFAAFPTEMVMAIAGLALLSTIANSLQNALAIESQKDAAFITFAVTASGLTLFGIGSAFWGLFAGVIAQTIFTLRFGSRGSTK